MGLFGTSATFLSSGGSGGSAIFPQFNVKNYGAKGDTKKVVDAVGVASGNHVTSATANFKTSDVGKTCWLVGNNNAAQLSPPNATILAVNSPSDVTVSSTVLVDSVAGFFTWGTDDTASVQAATAAAKAVSSAYNTTSGPCATVYFPLGGYILTAISTIDCANKISVSGESMYGTVLYIGPGFPYFNTGAGNVITNAVELTDFTLDAGNVTLNLGNIALVDFSDLMRRVHIYNWLAGTGANCVAATTASDNVTIENVDIFVTPSALAVHTLQCSIHRAYLNCAEIGLLAADTNNIRVSNSFIHGAVAGIQEGPTTAVTDWTFVNCRITSNALAVNMTKTGSLYRFDMCWLTGATVFTVSAGSTIYCGNSTVTSMATNAVNNAGDFWDLGGNVFTGAKAGGGTYHTAQFA